MQQTATALRKEQTSIAVFYSTQLLADAASVSPSAGKPEQVVAAWQEARLPIALQSFSPAAEIDFCLAHDPGYVRGVLSGALPNGFGNRREDVAHSLPFTTGAMIAAAHAALEVGCACAPVSGFHHAGYDTGGGFCTFNGLAVTAQKLIAEADLQHVLILDCDMHYGDGTEDIIEKLGLSHRIENCTFGRWFNTSADAPLYMARIREAAEQFNEFDLILYQAGADVHVDDPLGGVLTTMQMMMRDRLVFESARLAGVPIAWNLAGGYQKPLAKVVELHVNTMRECARSFLGFQKPETGPARSAI